MRFLLPSIILTDLLGDKTLTGLNGHGCDLWLVDFDPFCVFLCMKICCFWLQSWLAVAKNAIVEAAFELQSSHICEKCSNF